MASGGNMVRQFISGICLSYM